MTARFAGKTAIVTGAGHGIGRAIALRLAAEGMRIVVADLDAGAATTVARQIDGTAWAGDCANADGVEALVRAGQGTFGRLDMFVANAGIDAGTGLETPDDVWARVLEVNVMAHVRAARVIVPHWLADGRGGRFVATASAAGLLTMIGNAPYSVSKHAAVAFAEWLAVTYRHRGIVVQVVCPQGVRTAMLDNAGPLLSLLEPDAITPEAVAEALWDALQDERFLVLPHPEVAEFYATRAQDTDTWLTGMNRLQRRLALPTDDAGTMVP